MPERIQYRKHGDARLVVGPSFEAPLGKKARKQYLGILTNIMQEAHINIPLDVNDAALPDALLTLRQRFMIGYSNGCPWPEKAIKEHLEKQETPITSL